MRNNSARLAAVGLMAVLAGGALMGCSKSDTAAPAAPLARNVTLTAAQRQNIRLVTVAIGTFHKTVDTSGAVDFDNDRATSVLAPFSGPVSRLLVSPGNMVKQGDPLAIVASPDFATAIGGYRKALSAAQTSRRLADLDKDLLQHEGIAQREADQAETDAVAAEADREAALQTLISLNVDPHSIKDIEEGRTAVRIEGVIRAPIAGTVVEKLIAPGQLLQAGATPVFTVADLSRVWVMAQVFGADLASVSVGDAAQIITGIGSNNFAGKVDNIASLVDPDTRSVHVRVVADNPNGFLKKQMDVHVVLQSRAESTGLLVPVSAILRDDQNLPFVYVLQPDGSFARQPVTLGYRAGDQYEITGAPLEGRQIVADGGLFMQFMQSQ